MRAFMTSPQRLRLRVSALVVACGAMLAVQLPAAAATAAGPASLRTAPWHSSARTAGGTKAFHLAAPASIHTRALRVTMHASTAAVSATAQTPRSSRGGSPAAEPQSAASPSPSTAPAQLAAFAGTDQSSAIQSFGTDQQVLPPDPDIAVGPNNVVETTNSAIYVFSRTGSLAFRFDINAFVPNLGTDGYAVTDPRIIYDSRSGRFFFSVLAYSPTCSSPTKYPSEDFIAVSPTSTLSSGDTWNALLWQGFGFDSSTPKNLVGDQPGLGISNNLVAATQDAYNCTTGAFTESEALMVQKSDLIAGNLTLHSAVDYEGGPFAPQPAQSLGSTAVQYVVWNNSDGAEGGNGTMGITAFSGTPEAQNMPVSPQPVFDTMSPTSVNGTTGAIPSAAQAGTSVPLQTDDDRFQNAVWFNGRIWAADGTQCTPSGDTSARACLDFVGVTADSSGNVSSSLYKQLNGVGIAGASLYYPAVSVDASGNLFTVFDKSSSGAAESVVVAGLDLAAGGTSLTGFTTLHTSSTYYDPNAVKSGTCDATLGCRWGDYSGAAVDPSHPGDVWVVSEDADGSTSTYCSSNANYCWNTYIGRYTMSAPDAPVNVSAASTAPAQATLTWSPPADAGSSVTGYTITTYDWHRNLVGTISATSSPFTVTGLNNGMPYYFGITATNAFGTSPMVQTYSVTPVSGVTATPRFTAVSTVQYALPNSDGSTWQVMDESNLSLSITPTTAEDVLLGANADMWGDTAGYNQDIGLIVSANGGTPQLVAWKESGGILATFSPNAAFVETVVHMAPSTTYSVEVVWKTNKPAFGADINAGAGPISGAYSPTRLTAKVLPAGGFATAVGTQQYTLTNSDGSTWTPVDSTNLSMTLAPTADENVVLSGNADLWTDTSGYNQDIGIAVNGTVVAWKESGGFSGTFSPNAGYVQTVDHLAGGQSYTVTLVWKANKPAHGGANITIGAGPINGAFSPTRLTAWVLPSDTTTWSSVVSTQQYSLSNSDGSTWAVVDAAKLVSAAFRPASATAVIVSGNEDLWTSAAGYNQDIGLFVSIDGGTPQLVAWKESGGIVATFSPNAAFVQASYSMDAGHTYVFSLRWKANRAAPGATITIGAGPINGAFSPTRLTVVPA
jgi:Fibronectin type III domain